MSNRDHSTVVQSVKDFLGTDEDLSPQELYEMLYRYRLKTHPDLFKETDEKSEAEDRFKTCYKHLDNLSEYMMKERMINPRDIVVYDKDFEIVQSKQELLKSERELERYKNEIQYLQLSCSNLSDKVKTLESEIKSLKSTKVTEKTQELVASYKPTVRNYRALGITFVLSALIAVSTQIEQLSGTVFKYSPLNKSLLNSIVFVIFLLVITLYLKRFIEHKKVDTFAKAVKSQGSINGFYEYLTENAKDKEFSEFEVYQYIELKFTPNNFIKKHFHSKIIKVNEEETYEILKEIFIYSLFVKNLITYAGSENLKQKFKIKNSNSLRFDELNLDFEF
ncbi:hypothetical protein GZH47_22180 [Paenibacillus rhizovicinus]|uniref:J domain-containing protein n=1 Tax=Paenibacillus rhizovicinus TaxID=2704463 RepID=A0A6C0P4P4_9BACL|nr:hypothetical protein [Paenibacillus rhizovicinus]QHW33226.1 hypothetical protein GZH47_22180 [Paenibacillus rhizovicinus]